MALFNFPPFNASGSTGFLDPQLAYDAQASLLAPSTPESVSPGFNWGGENSLWTTLMGLGAGLATGGAPGGGGWGAGIGKGIGLAAELNQNRQTLEDKKAARDLQLATLQNTMQNQQIMQQLGIAGLGLRQQTEERQAETARKPEADQLTSLGSAAGTWQKTADFLTDPNTWTLWGTMKEGALGSGPIKDAQSQVQQVVEAGLGRKLTKDEVPAYVPQYNDSDAARVSKVARASELAQSRLQTAGSGKTENYRSGLSPIGKALGYVPSGTSPNITPPASTAAPAQSPAQANMIPGVVAGRPMPTPDKLQILRQYANNPEARAAFDDIYGPGAADHFLQGGQ